MNAEAAENAEEERERIFKEIRMSFEPDAALNALTEAVIGAAIEVHRTLGSGLDEGLYESAMCVELRLRGISFVRQPIFQVAYKGENIGEKRFDLVVAERLVVELKAVEQLTKLHHAQVNTYLNISKLPLGLLVNFNTELLKDGVKRVIRKT